MKSIEYLDHGSKSYDCEVEPIEVLGKRAESSDRSVEFLHHSYKAWSSLAPAIRKESAKLKPL